MRIVFSGFLFDGSGYGEASRRLVSVLQDREDVELAIGLQLHDGGWRVKPSPKLKSIIDAQLTGPADVHLIHCAAMDFDRVRPQFLTARRIGLTCIETDRLHPKSLEGCKSVEKVLAPSMNNLEILGDAGVPSAYVPYPISMPGYVDELEIPRQNDFEINEETYLFYCVTSWQERKNTVGMIMAYQHAFTRADNVALIIKISGPDWQKAQRTAHSQITNVLTMAQFGGPDYPPPAGMSLIAGDWTENQVWGLHNRGDCYLSLARGEAFGIPMMDAACIGNHVITTGWGGQLDFLPPELTTMLPYRMTPVLQQYTHFSGYQLWADPDLMAAVEVMRYRAAQGRRPKIRTDMRGFLPNDVGNLLMEAIR